MDTNALYQKLGVPTPNHNSLQVMKHLLAFWPSLGQWYKRKCDFTGEAILTNLSDKARFPIYKRDVFISDSRDPIEFDYDSSQKFFSQLKKLQESNPRPHQVGENNENCFYCDDVWSCKSCYLCASMLECENLFYCYRVIRCKDSVDVVFSFDVENSIGVTYGDKCYKVYYSFHVNNCKNSYFLYDCQNCSDCFMCWNLRDKQYCIENKQYTKQEYEAKISQYKLSSRSVILDLKAKLQNHIKQDAIHKSVDNQNSEDIDGTYTINCKNGEELFFVQESEDCKNLFRAYRDADCADCGGILDSKLCYMNAQISYSYNVKYSSNSIRCTNCEYVDNCYDCKNCFGCVSLKNKEYCILNKQYTKEEYLTLIGKIKEKMIEDGEYGKFLPYNMMYTGYNSTLSNIFYPDTKENIESMGGYRDEENVNMDIPTKFLPDDINDISVDFDKIVVKCTKTGRPFNFAKQAIELHKNAGLPLQDVFHLERVKEKFKPLTFNQKYTTNCYITGEEITHYYSPELGYKKIVSPYAYDKEIYG